MDMPHFVYPLFFFFRPIQFTDFWLLWIMLLWTFVYMSLYGQMYSFLLGRYLGLKLLDHTVSLCLTFLPGDTFIYFLKFIYLFSERVRVEEGQGEKSQARSVLSAQSPTWGSISPTVRSWPEPRWENQMLNGMSHPGVPTINFLRNCQTGFRRGCIISHSRQQWRSVPISPHPRQHGLLSLFCSGHSSGWEMACCYGLDLYLPND